MKKALALILALVMAFSLVACATNDTTDNTGNNSTANNTGDTTNNTGDTTGDDTADFNPADHKLTYATVLINHPVLRCTELGFKEACEELGYQWSVVGTETMDFNEQNTAGEAEIASGAEAILMWGSDSTAVAGCTMFKEDYGVFVGMPHVYYPEGSAPGLDFCKQCDIVTYATAAADFAAERLEGKTGSIALTQASFNENESLASTTFTERVKELQAEGKMQGITVLEPMVEGAEDVTESTNVNASIIQANPDLIAAFSWTGAGPVTWSNAARKCGKQPGDILIVSMDYTADNLAEIETGYCTAVIGQPLYDETYKSVLEFDRLLRGEEVTMYYEELPAPFIYKGGEGANDPATYQGILDRVAEAWG